MLGAILGVAGAALGFMGAKKQAKATQAAASYQANVSESEIKAQKWMFSQQLAFDKEKFDWAVKQAKGPLGQTGSYSYPYVTVTAPQKKQAEIPGGLLAAALMLLMKG